MNDICINALRLLQIECFYFVLQNCKDDFFHRKFPLVFFYCHKVKIVVALSLCKKITVKIPPSLSGFICFVLIAFINMDKV